MISIERHASCIQHGGVFGIGYILWLGFIGLPLIRREFAE